MTPTLHEDFPHTWAAQLLTAPPLIAPARQFIYPQHIPGEEDALNRGAILATIRPASGGQFLATCALGFKDPKLPSGLYACPRPDDLLAVAGGYAYLIDTLAPETCLHLPLKPVAQILPTPTLLLLAGFQHIAAIGPNGVAWQSARLSWEGLTLGTITGNTLHGTGWNMRTDRDVAFELDLRTGRHTGGGFTS